MWAPEDPGRLTLSAEAQLDHAVGRLTPQPGAVITPWLWDPQHMAFWECLQSGRQNPNMYPHGGGVNLNKLLCFSNAASVECLWDLLSQAHRLKFVSPRQHCCPPWQCYPKVYAKRPENEDLGPDLFLDLWFMRQVSYEILLLWGQTGIL